MARADRLALAFETGALALPEHGDVLVLRAVPSDFLDLVPPERLTCVQTFRPLHDALAAAGPAGRDARPRGRRRWWSST